ncbi:hypothetical protein K7X08_013571 [Anisodus acutangulus]|uniref:Uncharacterized protein n=1 Tax=Anisodus acutangulus TaxID=402998 RepID=A0A9Q1R3Y1_9SOLA|nr:hypothetical protein K7X08_013571 [Anisodus acutangulus]
MGGGGNMSAPTTKTEQKKNALPKVPSSKPPFTLGDIRKAIPPHCFQRSLIRSFSYLVQDLILVSIFYYIANTYFHALPSPYSYLAWTTYWIAQGCVCTGIWVIGHECGHHGFSDYQWVDDTVGLILHSALLTPYFAWKHSHRRHHANTGSLENDEVYIPRLESKLRWYYKYLNNPVGRVLVLAFTLTFAWPLYLIFNISGKKYDRFACHYDPYSPIYTDRERLQIYISDAGIIAATYVLYRLTLTQGLAWLVCIYGVPLLIVNGFIVLITLLHHTHSSLPHYDSSEWDYLRGALATVDRDYGVLNKVFHNVTDTHVLHHIFSYISHYHAMEATKAIKPLLGDYYQFDDTPILKAMWRDTKECIFVEKDKDKAIETLPPKILAVETAKPIGSDTFEERSIHSINFISDSNVEFDYIVLLDGFDIDDGSDVHKEVRTLRDERRAYKRRSGRERIPPNTDDVPLDKVEQDICFDEIETQDRNLTGRVGGDDPFYYISEAYSCETD